MKIIKTIVCILGIVFLVGGGYGYYLSTNEKLEENNKTKEDVVTENKEETEEIDPYSEEVLSKNNYQLIKKDSNFVKDTQYVTDMYNYTFKPYELPGSGHDDIDGLFKIPLLNIDSEDAKDFNNIMKNKYKNQISIINGTEKYDCNDIHYINYTSEIYKNNYLFIEVADDGGLCAEGYENNSDYKYNLKTNKLLSNNEEYELFGVTLKDIENSIKYWYNNFLDEDVPDYTIDYFSLYFKTNYYDEDTYLYIKSWNFDLNDPMNYDIPILKEIN